MGFGLLSAEHPAAPWLLSALALAVGAGLSAAAVPPTLAPMELIGGRLLVLGLAYGLGVCLLLRRGLREAWLGPAPAVGAAP